MDVYYEPMSGLIDNPSLYSTIRAGIIDQGTDETKEPLYDSAAKYCTEIAQALASFYTADYPTNDLMQYFSIPEDLAMEAAIKAKIRSAHVTVEAAGELLYARLDLDMAADLTVTELEAFAEQIEAQYQEGWGGKLELFNIPTQSNLLCLRLWHDELIFFTGAVKENFIPQAEQKKERSSKSRNKSSVKEKLAVKPGTTHRSGKEKKHQNER